MMDRDILPYVVLQWVNQDTLEVERSFLLDAAPKALKPNEKGYSLTASVLAPGSIMARMAGGYWPGQYQLPGASQMRFAGS